MASRATQLNELAEELIRLSRNQLLVNLRFMDSALSRLEPYPHPGISLATEGHLLVYDPIEVLRRYKADRAAPPRDYLHIVLHCVYRHMFVHTLVDHVLWDLACDIAVEYSISTLGLRAVEAERQSRQAPVFEDLQKKTGMLTAEKIYRYFWDNRPSDTKIAVYSKLFSPDTHELWYMTKAGIQKKGLLRDSGEDADPEKQNNGTDSANVYPAIDTKKNSDGSDGCDSDSERDWKSISERIEMDMQTFSSSKLQGDLAGGLIQNLRAINREKYDYSSFLRKFAVSDEVMKVNDDEFDYIFYTYGLQLFKNMPLIEPLEYKEVKRIREFVIAIDTSGSVKGKLVQAFIQKTYNILKSTESFFSKINLHIIQCDAAIQEHVKITTQKEFDAYLENMQIKGLGGTDFRPVFDFVDGLIRQHEFQNLKGLIYFTDGYGDFPTKMPDYTSAFVFINDEYKNPDVPPWAIKLVLQSDEI